MKVLPIIALWAIVAYTSAADPPNEISAPSRWVDASDLKPTLPGRLSPEKIKPRKIPCDFFDGGNYICMRECIGQGHWAGGCIASYCQCFH